MFQYLSTLGEIENYQTIKRRNKNKYIKAILLWTVHIKLRELVVLGVAAL